MKTVHVQYFALLREQRLVGAEHAADVHRVSGIDDDLRDGAEEREEREVLGRLKGDRRCDHPPAADRVKLPTPRRARPGLRTPVPGDRPALQALSVVFFQGIPNALAGLVAGAVWHAHSLRAVYLLAAAIAVGISLYGLRLMRDPDSGFHRSSG